MSKHNKPLRGLFSRTETASEPAKKEETKQAAPKQVQNTKAPVQAKPTATVPTRPALPTKPVPKPMAEIKKDAPSAPKPQEILNRAPSASAKSNVEETHIAPQHVKEPVVQATAAATPVKEVVSEELAIASTIEPTPHQEIVAQAENVTPHAMPSVPLSETVNRINYNFDIQKAERQSWAATNYIEFIRRIDAAQTEAFFLKGKLLEEAKERFYEDNKLGWKQFCEENLHMNYTTANQYIRVATEFDVTSHHRPDFGFEHFKALLPLPPEERTELISSIPAISVKSLRTIVQQKLMKNAPQPQVQPTVQAKSMIRLLQDLKRQVIECEPELLSQEQRWQLSAACRNLADELRHLAESLNPSVLATQRGIRTSNERDLS